MYIDTVFIMVFVCFLFGLIALYLFLFSVFAIYFVVCVFFVVGVVVCPKCFFVVFLCRNGDKMMDISSINVSNLNN